MGFCCSTEFHRYNIVHHTRNPFPSLSSLLFLCSLSFSLSLSHSHHPRLKLAFAINLSHLHNNFVHLFRLIRQLSSPFEKFALLTHIAKIRTRALQTMSSAYSTRNATFPLKWASVQMPETSAINKHYNIIYAYGWWTKEGIMLCTY